MLWNSKTGTSGSAEQPLPAEVIHFGVARRGVSRAMDDEADADAKRQEQRQRLLDRGKAKLEEAKRRKKERQEGGGDVAEPPREDSAFVMVASSVTQAVKGAEKDRMREEIASLQSEVDGHALSERDNLIRIVQKSEQTLEIVTKRMRAQKVASDKTIAELEARLAESERTSAAAEVAVGEARAEKEAALAEAEIAHRTKLEAMEANLNEKIGALEREEAASQEALFSELDAQLTAVRADFASVTASRAVVQAEADDLRAKLKHAEEKYAVRAKADEDALFSLRNDLSSLKERSETAEFKVVDLEGKLEMSMNDQKAAATALKIFEGEQEVRDRELTSLRDRVGELEAEGEELRKAYQAVCAERDGLAEGGSGHEARVADLEAQLSAARSEAEESIAAAQTQARAAEAEANVLRSQLRDAAEASVPDANAELERISLAHDEEIATFGNRVRELEGEIEDLRSVYQAVCVERDGLAESATKIDSMVDKFDHDSLQQAFDAMAASRDELTNSLAELRGVNVTLVAESEDLRRRVKDLDAGLSAAHARGDLRLEKEREALNGAMEAAMMRADEADIRAAKLEEEKLVLEEQVDAAHAELRDSEDAASERISVAEARAEAAAAEASRIRAESERLREQLIEGQSRESAESRRMAQELAASRQEIEALALSQLVAAQSVDQKSREEGIERDLESLREQLHTRSQDVGRLQVEVTEMASSLSKCDAERTKLNEEVRRLVQERFELTKVNDDLRKSAAVQQNNSAEVIVSLPDPSGISGPRAPQGGTTFMLQSELQRLRKVLDITQSKLAAAEMRADGLETSNLAGVESGMGAASARRTNSTVGRSFAHDRGPADVLKEYSREALVAIDRTGRFADRWLWRHRYLRIGVLVYLIFSFFNQLYWMHCCVSGCGNAEDDQPAAAQSVA